MTNNEILELFSRFENSSIQSLKLSRGDFSMELCKTDSSTNHISALPSPLTVPTRASVSTDDDTAICSPLVGTFYAAPSPGAAPFVTVGSKVHKGEAVCLIEAMKMMSEVPAPCDCIITEVLKEDGQLVSFDEAIIRYQPC
jgi:acetyl-CoA carboxylase biotin carboxyl carrier protein